MRFQCRYGVEDYRPMSRISLYLNQCKQVPKGIFLPHSQIHAPVAGSWSKLSPPASRGENATDKFLKHTRRQSMKVTRILGEPPVEIAANLLGIGLDQPAHPFPLSKS